jgi:daunorubicin resistance ABC transporter ATP-binding subunit
MATKEQQPPTPGLAGGAPDVPLAIDAVGLTKIFGKLRAVDGLDLKVPAGTVFSLLGPNGSGKTTTVRMLATLLKPDAGTAKVNGYDVRTQPAKVRGTLALTGQFAALDPNLTARENIALMAMLRGYSRDDGRRRADELLDRFDGAEFSGRLIKQLSGGQRRRVDLAAGLIDKPKLLVLDEPTTGLDPRSRQVVWATVRDLVNEGITLLLTTQYLEEADALADYIVLIDHGREIAAGTSAQLKALVGGQHVDVIAEDADGYEKLKVELEGAGYETHSQPEQRRISIPAPNALEDLGRVSATVAGLGVPIDEIALRRPTLDDAFITLTGRSAEDSGGGDAPVAAAGGRAAEQAQR